MAALNNNRWRDIDGGWSNGMDSIVWILVPAPWAFYYRLEWLHFPGYILFLFFLPSATDVRKL